ncbi:MAG: DUF327 family protein [Sulfobacillus sp.]
MQSVKMRSSTIRTVQAPQHPPTKEKSPLASSVSWNQLQEAETGLLRMTTLTSLDHYIHAVRDVLSKALQKQTAEISVYMSPQGRFRQMVHIRHLNTELAALHRDVRDGHKGSRLMERLDAIRGILVDIWL